MISRDMSKDAQNINRIKKKARELHSLETSEELWQEISIDIIRPLTRSNNKDTIVVIVDWFTKIIRLKATTITVSSKDIAKIYQDKIWKIHRIPWKVLSNRGPQFISKFMGNLTKALETKQTLSTVYHPQIDSQIERINQEVKTFLQYYVNYQQDDWTEWLLAVEFQYNVKKHIATEYTLFELNLGRLSWKTTKKLGNSKEVNENGKWSYEETVQQEKIEFTRIEERRKHVARSQ